jgi:2-polyprenyl-6-methoxyphenol hydroxylase-like FAD-dependent oxidoreductase
MAREHIGRRAVVVGAGIGGLAAAGALADFFERVVVLERDVLPAADERAPGDRAGTPQSRHIHALLAGGERALGELFAGFTTELAQAGAVPLGGRDFRVEFPGFDPFPQRDLGWEVYSMSRPLLEAVVRQQVRRLANVELRGDCQARELLPSIDGTGVVGVRCARTGSADETVSAELVVDASGRGALTLGLLEALGRPRPEEEAIVVDIGYATAIFAIPDDAPADWKGMRILPQPPDTRVGGLLLPLEHDRWMVTLGGRHDDKPPGDADCFLATAQRLRTPTLYNAIRRAKRLGGIARFGFPASTWRHFERLPPGDGFPRGLLPLGDAICRFNPVWGQGMSVAAQEAVVLRNLLDRASHRGDGDPLARLAPAFFAEVAELIETPWSSAAIPDFAYPKTIGERPPDLESRLEFARALNQLAAEDAAVHRLMTEVQHLLKTNSALREPTLVARVEAMMAAA